MNKTRPIATTPETVVRELDRRTSGGIDVRLLWSPRTNRVSVAVEGADASFELEIEPADALSAFHHPYAYASRGHSGHAFAA